MALKAIPNHFKTFSRTRRAGNGKTVFKSFQAFQETIYTININRKVFCREPGIAFAFEFNKIPIVVLNSNSVD